MLRTPLVWLEQMTNAYTKEDEDGSRPTTPGSMLSVQQLAAESASTEDDSREPRPQIGLQGATGAGAQGMASDPAQLGLNPPQSPGQPTDFGGLPVMAGGIAGRWSPTPATPLSPRSSGSHSPHSANQSRRSSRGTSMQDVLELRKHPVTSFSDPPTTAEGVAHLAQRKLPLNAELEGSSLTAEDGTHSSQASTAAMVAESGEAATAEPAAQVLSSVLAADGIASSLLCPITKQLMTDPVFTMDGQTYERSAIEAWLKTNDTSPVTGKRLPSKKLVDNVRARGMVRTAAEAQVVTAQAAAAQAEEEAEEEEKAVKEEGDRVLSSTVLRAKSMPAVPSLPTPANGAEPSSDQEGLPSPALSSSSAGTPASGLLPSRQHSRGTTMADVLANQKRNRGTTSRQVTSPVTSPKLTSSPSQREAGQPVAGQSEAGQPLTSAAGASAPGPAPAALSPLDLQDQRVTRAREWLSANPNPNRSSYSREASPREEVSPREMENRSPTATERAAQAERAAEARAADNLPPAAVASALTDVPLLLPSPLLNPAVGQAQAQAVVSAAVVSAAPPPPPISRRHTHDGDVAQQLDLDALDAVPAAAWEEAVAAAPLGDWGRGAARRPAAISRSHSFPHTSSLGGVPEHSACAGGGSITGEGAGSPRRGLPPGWPPHLAPPTAQAAAPAQLPLGGGAIGGGGGNELLMLLVREQASLAHKSRHTMHIDHACVPVSACACVRVCRGCWCAVQAALRQQMHEMHKLLRKQHSPEWWHAGQPPPPPHAAAAARSPPAPSTPPARTAPPWSPLGLPPPPPMRPISPLGLPPPQATVEPTAAMEQLERKVEHVCTAYACACMHCIHTARTPHVHRIPAAHALLELKGAPLHPLLALIRWSRSRYSSSISSGRIASCAPASPQSQASRWSRPASRWRHAHPRAVGASSACGAACGGRRTLPTPRQLTCSSTPPALLAAATAAARSRSRAPSPPWRVAKS